MVVGDGVGQKKPVEARECTALSAKQAWIDDSGVFGKSFYILPRGCRRINTAVAVDYIILREVIILLLNTLKSDSDTLDADAIQLCKSSIATLGSQCYFI